MPDFELEKEHGGMVCGLDEVGRAPLAGPVVAACVYIEDQSLRKKIWRDVNDSKALSASKRSVLAVEIKENCIWALGEACMREIETINIVQASFLAMKRAYIDLMSRCKTGPGSFDAQGQPDPGFRRENILALIDGHIIPKDFPCATKAVIKGDAKSVSIAAASIIAKVHRDEMMAKLAEAHPHYGWERNVGYPTPEHLAAIDAHGITDYHRRSFAPVQNYVEFGSTQRQMQMAI